MLLSSRPCCMAPRRACGPSILPLPRYGARAPWGRGLSSGPTRLGSHQACRAAQKVSELPSGLQKIVGSFQMVPDPMARYKQLLYYATKLQPMPAADHCPANKVEGCVSQVWVKPQLRDGQVFWSADSDSQLTKGLAALLVLGLSGCSPSEIIKVDPGFIEMLGLKQSLTPSRNNGFLNMLRLMQRKTLELIGDGETSDASGSTATSTSPHGAGASASADDGPASSSSGRQPGIVAAPEAVLGASASSSAGPSARPVAPGTELSSQEVQERMRHKLTQALKPSRITIVDESPEPKQSRQAAMQGLPVMAPRELHFRLEIVSPEFEGVSKVKRQRMVYQVVNEEFSLGLHALSLDTKAPSEL